ncbi:hypothetical protein DUI87_09197 [Hirundo rustica rustica]|uniref:Uncharacterized protein n=1 Tax=Hirundo rustica rustica TaxID=333673 RepID=A0A3M0KLH9_HIRRU|nr:hypothetical protein DUI87_09197 [Hirundo rustica rustica]
MADENSNFLQGKRKYRHSIEWIEITPEDKDLWIFVDKKLDVTQQCALEAHKAWAASNAAWPAGQERFSLSATVKPHPEYCTHLWGLQQKKDISLLECVQRRTTKLSEGWSSYEDRMRELGLFSLKKTLQGDPIHLPVPKEDL